MKTIAVIARWFDTFSATVYDEIGTTKPDVSGAGAISHDGIIYLKISSPEEANGKQFDGCILDDISKAAYDAEDWEKIVDAVKARTVVDDPLGAIPKPSQMVTIVAVRRDDQWNCDIQPGPRSQYPSTVEMLTLLTGLLNSYWDEAAKEYGKAMGIPLPCVDMEEVKEWIQFQNDQGL